MVRKTAATGAALLALALATADPSFAQEPAGSYAEGVEVRVVNVDVFVTDRKGRPIPGLTASDFELFEDGQPVTIQFFSSPTLTSENSTQQPVAARSHETASTGPHVSDLPRPEDVLRVVLYLDNHGLDPAHRQRILDDLQAFARGRSTEVELALAVYEPGLEFVTAFDDPLDKTLQALEATVERPAKGLAIQRGFVAALDRAQTVIRKYESTPTCNDPCICGSDELRAVWNDAALIARNRVHTSADGLSELVRALAGIPGRKAVLYAGSGMEQRPGLGVLQYLMDVCPQLTQTLQRDVTSYDETPLFLDLSAYANANRVTLYPLDAGGIRPDLATGVEWDSQQFRPSSLVTQIRTSNLQSPLYSLAERTGGRAIFNANAPAEELLEIADELPHAYSLGFEPPHPVDGRTHRLTVRLASKKKGVQLRYRRSYRDRTPEDQLLDQVVATLAFGEEENPLRLAASVGEIEKATGKVSTVPVQLSIPLDTLGELYPQGLPSEVDVVLILSARDQAGRLSTTRQKTVQVTTTPEATVASVVVNMELRPGEYTIAIGARHVDSGVRSSTRLQAQIGR